MNIPSKENPDDRPQPPQRMNSEERSNEEALRTQARNTMRSLLGSGYVDSYYDGAASDFVGLAQWWASVQVAAVERERDAALARIADYEHRISWDTTCGNCARMLDTSIKDYERTERALARIAAVEAENESLRRINDASEWRPRLVELRAELDAMTRYAAALTRGLSDYEARAEGWPDAALAASPTPTGPEPARCGEFNPGTRSWYRCTEPQGHDGDHVVQRPGFSSVYARWPGPATPEPTEETP